MLLFSGDICPKGHYCIQGSASGAMCPPGTFLNTTGGVAESDCIECTQGYYCAGYGNIAVTWSVRWRLLLSSQDEREQSLDIHLSSR
ncbi:hypothetical protein DPMN_185106 [Dreissena polymorpha]|uniref:Uncharacterized protein n=1 Tax=Dreissena polymorpha TaxID=45954 RepID=A0A9D4I711_DREPO|nr:hypothetical protein DPMN_185106 [Dreissena polymorpha]